LSDCIVVASRVNVGRGNDVITGIEKIYPVNRHGLHRTMAVCSPDARSCCRLPYAGLGAMALNWVGVAGDAGIAATDISVRPEPPAS
jgi:hypothetical protein